jgi:UDP-glucose 4-epimerase
VKHFKLALVTGSASFIETMLTDQLLARGAKVRIVDDLSSEHIRNIRQHLGSGKLHF